MDQGAFAMQERIVAIGLLTQRDLTLLGPTFELAWPIEDVPAFSELLHAIDDADQRLQDEAERRDKRH